MERTTTSEQEEGEEVQSCKPLDVYHFFVSQEEKINCSLRVLGSQMGLSPPVLNDLERESVRKGYDFRLQLINLFQKCSEMRVDGLSWRWIAQVLKQPSLNLKNAAIILERQYIRRSSIASDSSIRSLSSSLSSIEPPSPTSPIALETEFSIPNVVNHIHHMCKLGTIKNWRVLGLILPGISQHDIDEISEYDPRERIQRLVEAWICHGIEPSWELLQQKISEAAIRRESIESAVSIVPLSTPISTKDIESQLEAFDLKFGSLLRDARKELERKDNAVELIVEELESLPPRIFKESYKHVKKVSMKTSKYKFTDLKTFFQYLRLHCWNFFEYKILEFVINKNCSEELQEKMKNYKRDLQALKDRTTISEFLNCDITCDLVKKARVPETFKTLTTHHCINPDTHTLSDLDKFRIRMVRDRQRVFVHRSLLECAMQLYTIKYGSIVVEWIFPEELTGVVVDILSSDEGQEMLKSLFIEKTLIDGKTVHTLLLLTALKEEDVSKIKSLLKDEEADIDVNSTHQKTEQTALIYCAQSGDVELVNLLLKRKADVHKTDKLQRSALILASHEGHLDIVRLLLENGARPNQQATKGWTALMLASYRGHIEVVELLLKQKNNCDVNLTTEQGWTALQRLCLYNKSRYPKAKYEPVEEGIRTEVAKLLLDYGTDLWILDKDGRTPLIAASDSGFVDIVKLIIDKIADFPEDKRQEYLDHKKHYSWTALMCASEKGHTEVVKHLIEAGASTNLNKEKDNVSALHIAVENNRTEVVEILVHTMDKDNLNTKDNYDMTPLMLATRNRNEQMINVLIHAGADVDAYSTSDEVHVNAYSASHMQGGDVDAYSTSHMQGGDVDAYSTSRKVDVDAYSASLGGDVSCNITVAVVADTKEKEIYADHFSELKTEQTALIYCAKSGDVELVNLLLKRKADVHKTDKLQRSALILASHEGHLDIVRLLLENGARPNQQATKGWTALMLASYRGHTEVVELLLKQMDNCDVNLTTEQGWTALQRLCLYNKSRYPKAKYEPVEEGIRTEVAKLLLDYGTDLWILDKEGRTPLIAASDSGFADIVKLIIDKIADFPEDKRQEYLDHKKHYSWTALMCASEKGHAEIVRLLIEAGASTNITKEKDDVSALHIAVEHNRTEIVETLVLEHKMDKEDLNARDNYGMTPLILAAKNRSEQMINVLIHAGADVDAKTSDGEQMTALMFAIKVGSFDVVKMLVEHSANIFATDSKKQTVLELAKNSSKEIHDYISKKCMEAEEFQSQTSIQH